MDQRDPVAEGGQALPRDIERIWIGVEAEKTAGWVGRQQDLRGVPAVPDCRVDVAAAGAWLKPVDDLGE
jgi:hypothetical protein